MPRTIVVKTLMCPDEYLAFDAACKAADKPHSKALRDLSKDWIARQHDRRRPTPCKWPAAGQDMAMHFPARVNYAMRM